MTPKSNTADAPNEVTIMGVWYTSRKAVLVPIIASMSRMPPKAPIQAKIHTSCCKRSLGSHVNGGMGIGSYGGSDPGGL